MFTLIRVSFFVFKERLHPRRAAALGFCALAFAAACAGVRCSMMPFFGLLVELFYFFDVKTAFIVKGSTPSVFKAFFHLCCL